MAKQAGRRLDEADLHSPDQDEGQLDVERYRLPDSSGIEDEYVRGLWDLVVQQFPDGTLIGDDDDDAE